MGTVKGEYELPDMANDVEEDGEEWEVRTSFTEDKNNLRSRVDNIVRKEAPKDLRKTIKEKFVNELKQK